LSTSKQGMIRLVSIVPFSGPRPSDVDAVLLRDSAPGRTHRGGGLVVSQMKNCA